MFFILHNICRFIIGLKMNKPLIVVFYFLILLVTVFRIAEFSLRLENLGNDLIETSLAIFYANTFALFIAFCVELTLILTMHWLTLSLKLICGEIDLY